MGKAILPGATTIGGVIIFIGKDWKFLSLDESLPMYLHQQVRVGVALLFIEVPKMTTLGTNRCMYCMRIMAIS